MRFFLSFIKHKRYSIAAYILCCVIFICAFLLYRLPLKAALHTAAVCILLGIAILIISARKAYIKHKRLNDIAKLSAELLCDVLPPALTQDDKDYQQIIKQLINHQIEFANEQNARYRDMTDYYTVWAHQIKTPIASMRLHLQNEDTALSQILSAELTRIEQYVQMVMAFLRLGSNSTDYVIREYDLDGIVKNCVKRFSEEFISRKIKLIYEPVNTKVITDEKWLSFVIEQVLSNALKYTPSGSIEIKMQEPKKLLICDTGIGIAAQDLPRIFENGYTGYNGRWDKKASGIGLYLCRQICGNLGHGIYAASKPGSGTVITIDLAQKKFKPE